MSMQDAYVQITKDLIKEGVNVTTLEGYFTQQLCFNGMFPNQAKEVMTRHKESEKTMEGRWHHPMTDYEGPILRVTQMNIWSTALKYIDETCPMAWFRPMFDPKQLEEITKELDGK